MHKYMKKLAFICLMITYMGGLNLTQPGEETEQNKIDTNNKKSKKNISYHLLPEDILKLIYQNCDKSTQKAFSSLSTDLYRKSCDWVSYIYSSVGDHKRLNLLLGDGRFPNLRHLSLYDCLFTTNEGLLCLSNLTNLKKLNLGLCQDVTDSGLRYLSNLPNLEDLDLDDLIEITLQGLQHLSTLTKMKKLSVAGCIGINNFSILSQFTDLKELDFGDDCKKMQIDDSVLGYLSTLTNLQKFSVGNTADITDEGLGYLFTLTNLQEIFLPKCRNITDKGLTHISKLINLQKLNLRGCGITNKKLKNLSTLTKLHELWLSWEQLPDEGLEHIPNLKNLRDLVLSWGSLKESQVLELTSKFPNLKVWCY